MAVFYSYLLQSFALEWGRLPMDRTKERGWGQDTASSISMLLNSCEADKN